MWTVVGNRRAIETLQRAVESGPAHAYLFAGPASVGKARAALEFAAALNCVGTDKPCGACRSCRDVLAGRHPDVEAVAPGGVCDEAEHRDHGESRDLRICQVRRLERVLSLTPYSGGRRIAIVDSADMLTTEAANAFLKTLEEPPDATVLVLISDREEQLPETVLSRCQRIAFFRVDRETVREALAERGTAPNRAATLAALANGRFGWALRACADESLLEEREVMLDTAVRVAHSARAERFAWARRADDRSSEVRQTYLRELDVWESWWRDILAVAAGAAESVVNADRSSVLNEESKLYSAGAVVTFLRALDETRGYLKENVDPQLALENLTLDLPQPKLGLAAR